MECDDNFIINTYWILCLLFVGCQFQFFFKCTLRFPFVLCWYVFN